MTPQAIENTLGFAFGSQQVLAARAAAGFMARQLGESVGQTVEDAIRQYKTDRDPREPFFAYGRCLAHFAVDPDLVYVTTHLAGLKTRFLPLNQGKFGPLRDFSG
mgnify:CR=1 FL=1